MPAGRPCRRRSRSPRRTTHAASARSIRGTVAMAEMPLVTVEHVSRQYRLPRESVLQPPAVVRALHDVSFTLHVGTSLGVVGESGSGKSTLARLVMALERPDAGVVRFNGQDLAALDAPALRSARSGFQMVFQDPYG